MDRRKAIAVLALLASGSPRLGVAQSRQIRRIGVLWIKGEGDSSVVYLSAFRDGLRAQGYVDGRDVEIDDRFLVERYPQLPDAATRLVNANVDLLLCFGGTAINAAAKATTTLPIVAITATDPVAAKYAKSLAHPGGNITGVATVGAELALKRLQLLKQLLPNARNVGVPFNPESAREEAAFKKLVADARTLNLELRAVPVHSPGELEAAVAQAANSGVGAFAPLGSTMFAANPKQLVDAVQKTNLPAIYTSEAFVRVGGLVSYGTSSREAFRQASVIVVKVFKGSKPADLPFEQTMNIELVINLKTAKVLGLAIPKDLVLRADEVLR